MNVGHGLISTILRHDAKQTSYKIALLRAINDVALSYPDFRTVEHGYPYITELVTQFFEQLATKSHLEQARIRGIVGIKRSKVFFQQKKLGVEAKH